MCNVPESIKYDTEKLLESIKLLKFMLISLRKIGDHSIDSKEFDIKDEVYNFIVEGNVLDKLAEIRMTLENEFENFPRIGEKSFLEAMSEDIEYWTIK